MAIRGGYIQSGQWYPIDAYAEWQYEDLATDFPIGTTGGDWKLTNFTSGTAALADVAGGWLLLSAGASTADQGLQLQKIGNFILPAANKTIFMQQYTNFITSPSTCQFFFGAAEVDATLFAAGINTALYNFGFEMDAVSLAASGAKLQFVSENNGTRTTVADVYTLTAGEEVLLEIVVNGTTNIQGYVNGVLVATITTNIPTSLMTPSIVTISEGTTEPKVRVAFNRAQGTR